MQLKYDPIQIFKNSVTPAGLYARQKWLGEFSLRNWKSDFQNTLSELSEGQSSDGSWGHSIVKTISHLFGLHLTARNRTEPIEKAMTWLLNEVETVFPKKRINIDEVVHTKFYKGQPFTKGCSGLFMYGATLFLSSIFGFQDEKTVLKIYEWLNSLSIQNRGRWCGWSCSNNVLRAFVVHPNYSKSTATNLMKKNLAEVQDSNGKWIPQVPFYQTVNALAHLNAPESDRQVELAFKRLYDIQNRDGTWGRSDRGWNTFLVVHALKNKGEL